MGTDDSTEYKGQMRLPGALHAQASSMAELTGNSLNALVVQAVDMICQLGAGSADATVPVPKIVALAHAAREHARSPKLIRLSEHVARVIRPPSVNLHVAEDPPNYPAKAPAKRAKTK